MEFESILKGFLGLSVLLAGFGPPLWAMWKLKRIPSQSSEKLQELIRKPGRFPFYGPAVRTLAERNEDYSAVLPNLLTLCLAKKQFVRQLAWAVLSEYFADVAKEVNYDPLAPSSIAKDQISYLLGQIPEDSKR